MNELPLQSEPGDWRRINGRRSGEIRFERSGPFRRVFYRHTLRPDAAALRGKRILLFSDLHIRPQTAASFPGGLRWNGAGPIRDFLLETVECCRPDHIFFGGDMMAYLCNFTECIELFRALRCPGLKIGVYGNWDLMRPWLPDRDWRRAIQKSGLRLLVNEARSAGPMRVFGLDDFRKGSPEYREGEKRAPFECVLTHNPDTVPQVLTLDMMRKIDLILCGHTHGGQIRLPLFGAMATSSLYWKTFEYGLYAHRRTGTRMLITAGLGVTFIRRRIFCPPEAVIIELT
ncbi:MAG: metallophosphoesterase family protein [Lentisphaeria bacterium]|nr:metallophosphoesterase family protein [Lentisphaeria bacterium]